MGRLTSIEMQVVGSCQVSKTLRQQGSLQPGQTAINSKQEA